MFCSSVMGLLAIRMGKWSEKSELCCSLKKKHFLEMNFSEKRFLQPGTPMLLCSHSEYCQLYSSVPSGLSWSEICSNVFCSIVSVDHLNFYFSFRHWHVNSKQCLWCSLPTSRCTYALLQIHFSAGVTQEASIHRHYYLLSVALKMSSKCGSSMKTLI